MLDDHTVLPKPIEQAFSGPNCKRPPKNPYRNTTSLQGSKAPKRKKWCKAVEKEEQTLQSKEIHILLLKTLKGAFFRINDLYLPLKPLKGTFLSEQKTLDLPY